jgi:hypothetical protein
MRAGSSRTAVVAAYILEGHLMLGEGVPAPMIENVARMAGMPVGPLSLNDEVGIDLALRIVKATKAQVGEAAVNPMQEQVLTALVERDGRLGRKNGKGFYDYPPKGQGSKRLWPGLADLQQMKLDPDTIDVVELKHRFLVVQALEAARTVEEGVVTDPREADVGSILGFGFAPFTGGALSYIDGMGAHAFVELARSLAVSTAPGSRRTHCLSKWPRPGAAFTSRSRDSPRRQRGAVGTRSCERARLPWSGHVSCVNHRNSAGDSLPLDPPWVPFGVARVQ